MKKKFCFRITINDRKQLYFLLPVNLLASEVQMKGNEEGKRRGREEKGREGEGKGREEKGKV